MVLEYSFCEIRIIFRGKNRVTTFSPPKSTRLSPKLSTSSTKTTSSTNAIIGSASSRDKEKTHTSGQPPPHLAHFFTNSHRNQSTVGICSHHEARDSRRESHDSRRESHDSHQESHDSISTSRKSSSNSSSLSKASMTNHVSRRGSVSVQADGDKMEEYEDIIVGDDYEGRGDVMEEYPVPFPHTRPTKLVKPPPGSWWSSMR